MTLSDPDEGLIARHKRRKREGNVPADVELRGAALLSLSR